MDQVKSANGMYSFPDELVLICRYVITILLIDEMCMKYKISPIGNMVALERKLEKPENDEQMIFIFRLKCN